MGEDRWRRWGSGKDGGDGEDNEVVKMKTPLPQYLTTPIPHYPNTPQDSIDRITALGKRLRSLPEQTV